MPRRTPMSSGDREPYSSAYSPSAADNRHVDPAHRAFEGIKDKLQLLSGHSGTGEHSGKESNTIAVCGLADDF